jgi:hypothetical protein
MIKKLFSGLSIVALLFTACKKSDMLPATGENQRTLTSTPTEPTAVVSPTVFFVENDVLFSVSNITAETPTVTYKGVIPGIELFGDVKANVFNTNPYGQPLVYNPFTDQILCFNEKTGTILNKCSTSKLAYTTGVVGGHTSFRALAVNPADKKFYYCCIKQFLEDGVNSWLLVVNSVNMDGTNNTEVRSFGIDQQSPSNRSDIDFKKNLIYIPTTDGIAITDLLLNTDDKLFLPNLSANETIDRVKFDPINNTIFFSTTLKAEKRKRIWRIDASGDKKTLKLIRSIAFTDPAVTFNFDISPKTNTVFVCKRELTALNQHHSIIMRVNMDGTGSKIIKTGSYINNVVVAEPVL